MRRNCCGSLRPNARRSGEANGEDRYVQKCASDRCLFLLFAEEVHMFMILSVIRSSQVYFVSFFSLQLYVLTLFQSKTKSSTVCSFDLGCLVMTCPHQPFDEVALRRC